jgi:hypothetical protein
MPDAEIKRLMKNLGESINETLSESPKINESIQSIRDAGYEVFLIIEAKIGFNRKGKGDNETISTPVRTDDPVRLRITTEDAKFLKSLKIAVDTEQ